MTDYAIGAIDGDLAALSKLLSQIEFDREQDRLWFSGNLVNGGPDSLAVLRFARELGRRAVVVLGLQELRLLAIAEGVEQQRQNDKFTEVLSAEDRDVLLKWLYQRPLLHHEAGYTLIHAGIPAEWTLSQARTFAIEAESSLAMGNHMTFFENLAGTSPTRWHAKLRGWKRLRFIVNALTRLSYCDDSGRYDFTIEDPGIDPGENFLPWSRQSGRAMAGQNIVCANVLGAASDDVQGIFPLKCDVSANGSLCALRISDRPKIIRISRG